MGNLKQAFSDWNSGRAYLDNNGNYRVRGSLSRSGKIAPWNLTVKRGFKSHQEFSNAASNFKQGGSNVLLQTNFK